MKRLKITLLVLTCISVVFLLTANTESACFAGVSAFLTPVSAADMDIGKGEALFSDSQRGSGASVQACNPCRTSGGKLGKAASAEMPKREDGDVERR